MSERSPTEHIIAIPVPFSWSAKECSMILTSLPNMGVITVFPTRCAYLLSFLLKITLPQVHISSGLVVAITISSPVSLTFHLTKLNVLGISLYSISESAIVVLSLGSQLLILTSSYISPLLYKSTNVA